MVNLDGRYIIGYDSDGITRISLDNLKEIKDNSEVLEEVHIAGTGPSDIICSFVFKRHGIYNASGFSVGYSGEGPHGLYEAIKMFHPDKIQDVFHETAINELDPNMSWDWTPQKGFTHS